MDSNLLKPYSCEEFNSLIRQKNKKTFDFLYKRYNCLLYGIALRSLKSEEQAEKITELTFLNMWHSLHLWRSDEKIFSIWLVGILINTTKGYLESQNLKYILVVKEFPYFHFEVLD